MEQDLIYQQPVRTTARYNLYDYKETANPNDKRETLGADLYGILGSVGATRTVDGDYNQTSVRGSTNINGMNVNGSFTQDNRDNMQKQLGLGGKLFGVDANGNAVYSTDAQGNQARDLSANLAYNNSQSPISGSVYANRHDDAFSDPYTKYGGQAEGRLGGLAGTISGSKERQGEWESNGRSVGLQYTPEQLKGLVMQAAIAKRDDNFGNASRTASGGVSYLSGNWNAGMTGSREQRNNGTVDNTIDAKIGYRF